MAVFKNASLKLDSPRSVFYPGQVITGSLEIEFETPLTLSVIYVKFLGEATVNWTEQESEEVNGRKRYKKIEYKGREEYFKGSQLLAGAYGGFMNMNPGKYTYAFEYRLPRGIPSNFTGDRGGVVYSVIGRVEFQGQSLFKDEMIKYFDVVAPFDLNKANERVKEPIEMEFEEVYGCGCFCSSNPVSIRVRLPYSAYCPGQAIPVAVAVENNSSVEISSMIFELLTRERYRTQRPVAEYVPPEEVVATVKKGSIMSGNTRSFTVDLLVPDLIAPNLEDCSVIDVGYFFRITIKLSGCNDDLQDEAEICLGLIPLHETVEGTYIHPMAHSLPVGPAPEEAVLAPGHAHTQQASPGHTGYPTVPEGTSYYVQVNQHVTSTDPSQNYQMGFKVSYPPGSEVPPFNQQFGQLNGQQWPAPFEADMSLQMNNLMNNRNFGTPNLAPNNSFVPRGRSPVPSAPPM